jgi:hypothetical protein
VSQVSRAQRCDISELHEQGVSVEGIADLVSSDVDAVYRVITSFTARKRETDAARLARMIDVARVTQRAEFIDRARREIEFERQRLAVREASLTTPVKTRVYERSSKVTTCMGCQRELPQGSALVWLSARKVVCEACMGAPIHDPGL